MTRMVLEAAGFEVRTLESALGLAAVLAREEPHIALVDVVMPALPGPRAVEIVRRYFGTATGGASRRCPIILYSALDEAELRSIALESGADGFISKSTPLHQLPAEVRRHLHVMSATAPV